MTDLIDELRQLDGIIMFEKKWVDAECVARLIRAYKPPTDSTTARERIEAEMKRDPMASVQYLMGLHFALKCLDKHAE